MYRLLACPVSRRIVAMRDETGVSADPVALGLKD